VTTLPRPAEGTGALRAPAAGTAAGYPRPPLARPHILVVNGRKVRHPVFIIGAPHAGTEMLARAFKRTPGFHMTLGQRWVLPVVQAALNLDAHEPGPCRRPAGRAPHRTGRGQR